MRVLTHSPRLRPPIDPRICWRKDLAVPHESLWGRLHKLSLLNQIAGRDIEQLMFDKCRPREHSYSKGWDAGDLRVRASYDEEKLRSLSHPLSPRTMGTVSDYIENADDSRYDRGCWSVSVLRFCPKCIQMGIHVTYFQLPLVGFCPVHGTPLKTACPSCRGSISYQIPAKKPEDAFRCHCGYHLWNWRRKPLPQVTDDLVSEHERAGAWVVNTCRSRTVLHYCWDGSADDDPKKTYVAEGFTKLATFFPLAIPGLGRLKYNYQEDLTHLISSKLFSSASRSRTHGAFAKKSLLIATYKSICRNLYRHKFRAHRGSIRAVAKIRSGLTSNLSGLLSWPYPFAPVAMAFVLWRMYWETLISPDELFRPRVSLRRLDYSTERIHWKTRLVDRVRANFGTMKKGIARPIADEIDLRWFAEVCLRTFDECLIRVVRAHKGSRKRDPLNGYLYTNWVVASLVPLMLADIRGDGSVLLHWYYPYGGPIREIDFWKALLRKVPSRIEEQKFIDALDLDGSKLLERVSRRLR
jgi:hypothetical protein